MSGTDVANGSRTECPVLTKGYSYGIFSTDVAFSALCPSIYGAATGSRSIYVRCGHGMSGTDLGYGATSAVVGTKGM
eukprot:1160725-Rhodomonas_salina.1